MNDQSGDRTPAPAGVRPRLLVLPGSPRRQSHNRRLAIDLAGRLAAHCEIDLVRHGEVTLPLFDEDLEQSAPVVAQVIALYARIRAADGLVIASPEHNSQVTAYLKNLVDWVSRLPRIDPTGGTANVFRHKPVLLTSASTGWTGGVAGLQAARLLLSYVGCEVAAAQICVANVEQFLVTDGFEFPTAFDEYIQRVIEEFAAGVARACQPATPSVGRDVAAGRVRSSVAAA